MVIKMRIILAITTQYQILAGLSITIALESLQTFIHSTHYTN